MLFSRKKLDLPTAETALKGRAMPIPTAATHFVNGHPINGPWPQGLETAVFGMGCFWGAERKFWELGDGIYATAVGWCRGGFTAQSGPIRRFGSRYPGHNEAVPSVFDPKVEFLRAASSATFWENHDPTQGMRQGNDSGTQYRSAIYVANAEQTDASAA